MHDPTGATTPQGRHAGARQVVGVDVVGVDVVFMPQQRAAAPHPLARIAAIAVERIDARDAQQAHPRAPLGRLLAPPPAQARFRVDPTAPPVGGRLYRARLVEPGSARITIDAGGAAVHQRLHAATPTQGLQQAGRARVLVARRGRRRQVQHPCGQPGQARQRAGGIQIANDRHQALRPQRRHAVSLRGQSQHATTGAQCLRGTLAHISAAHNEDTGLTKSGRTRGLRLEHGRSERKSSLRF